MPRYVAFLRGINLGNRRLKMDQLRGHFEAFGFDNVDTFLASGNVVFDDPGDDPDRVEDRIEAHLAEALGYAADTFVRSLDRLGELTALELAGDREDGFNPHVIFLKEPGDRRMVARLSALETADDRFHVLGREVVWLRRGRLTESSVRSRDLERALGGATNTMRNLNTVERIVAKFA